VEEKMKPRFTSFLLFVLALAVTLSISARPAKDNDHQRDDRRDDGRDDRRDDQGRDRDRDKEGCGSDEQLEHARNTPLHVVGVIPIPGPNPLQSSDLTFADPITERVYFADRSNFAVDVFDAENDVFVGRVSGFAGPNSAKPPNGQGPNGVLATKNKLLWVGDGNSILRVVDIDSTHTSPLTYLTITHSISTANPECDSTTVHTCGRADELGWDPADHLILINNDAPILLNSTAGTPYGTWVSTDTFAVVGQVLYPLAGGAEQPVWDANLGRFFVTLPGSSTEPARFAVIKPGASSPEKFYDVSSLVNAALGSAVCTTAANSANGLTLGVNQHLLASACGVPVVLSALDGHAINVISQVAGGDEVWANPGDERFYVAGADKTAAAPQPTALGVIDQKTGQWLQNIDAPGATEPTAFAETNHIFTGARTNATGTPLNPSTDTTVCAQFGDKGTGCLVLYEHNGSDGDR
jgi:hypothetical protein